METESHIFNAMKLVAESIEYTANRMETKKEKEDFKKGMFLVAQSMEYAAVKLHPDVCFLRSEKRSDPADWWKNE